MACHCGGPACYLTTPLKRETQMALLPNNAPTREDATDIRARFLIAQDGRPTQPQLDYQADLRAVFAGLAVRINEDVEDSREKSLAITALEEALMWTGKAIFR